MAEGENNFSMEYDPTHVEDTTIPSGKYQAELTGSGDGWKVSQGKGTTFRHLPYEIVTSDGEKRNVDLLLCVGVQYRDKKTGKTKSGDFTLQSMMAAYGMLEATRFEAASKEEFIQHLKEFVDNQLLPAALGRNVTVQLEKIMDPEYGPKNEIKRFTPCAEVSAARKEAYKALARAGA